MTLVQFLSFSLSTPINVSVESVEDMVIVTHISAPEPESSTPRVLASQVWMATEFTEIYVKVHQKQN